MRVRQLIQFLRGNMLTVDELTASYDGVSEERIKQELESLEKEGVLEHFFRGIYVVSTFNDEQKEKEAVKRIRAVSSRLHSDANTKTTVKVSGAAVENKEYKTDKTLSEVLSN